MANWKEEPTKAHMPFSSVVLKAAKAHLRSFLKKPHVTNQQQPYYPVLLRNCCNLKSVIKTTYTGSWCQLASYCNDSSE